MLAEMQKSPHFICEVCALRYLTRTSLEVHHKRPQLAGIDDTRKNLAKLCGNCHGTVHTIGASMAGTARKKIPATVLAHDYAMTTNPKHAELVEQSLLKMASLVAQAISEKKAKTIEGGDVVTVLELPPKWNALFKELGRRIKHGPQKTPIGKERLLQCLACDALCKNFPELETEIRTWLNTEVLGIEAPRPEPDYGIGGKAL